MKQKVGFFGKINKVLTILTKEKQKSLKSEMKVRSLL